jgi:fructose-1,6-bisphosphatase/inositol monophosphatase family enzyme
MDEAACFRFGFGTLLEIGALVRAARQQPCQAGFRIKTDGTPVTSLDERIEHRFHARLHDTFPNVAFVGEETGGQLPSKGFAVAMDPLDGTWSFINHDATCSINIAFFKDAHPFLGMVLNPATGEIGYAGDSYPTRLLQMSAFGEDAAACTLPTKGPGCPDNLLIHIHPSRDADQVKGVLLEAWSKGEVGMVKTVGGSPTWALLEAAKGHTLYVNLWRKRPATPFDLPCGLLLVRQAGGDVVDLAQNPLLVEGHRGPFIAGISEEARRQVGDLLRPILS